MFTGDRWFCSNNQLKDFSEEQIPEGQFQCFSKIVRYIHFVTRETVLTSESKRDEVHTDKVRKTKDQMIVISDFKTDVPPIMGGLEEGKDTSTTLAAIMMLEFWNAHEGVRRVFLRTYKYIQDHRIKLQYGINRELQMHMEAQVLVRNLLVKCGVFWYQLAVEIEAFYNNLVTTMYGESAPLSGKAE